MSQDYKEKAGKKNGQMTKISLVALLVVLLFVIEMYEIINDPANMIVIGALGAFLLVSVYVEMLFIGKLTENRAKEQEEAFDNVYRSEKASYLLMRKYFDQMDRKMENFGDLSNIPYKELIAAQKALAKAQINRNKQNTNALLISNDRMMQRLTSMQNDLTDILANTNTIKNENADTPVQEIAPVFSEEDRETILHGNKNVLETQQEILHNIKELETSLRNEILESANKVASINSQQMSVPKSQMQINETEDEIAPLDIDHDLPDIEPELQSVLENSFTSEPELPPISDESPLTAISEESDLQSILGEPVLQPVFDSSILGEPELQPVTEDSMIEEPELQPVANTASILEEPELQPISDSLITQDDELPPILDNSVTQEAGLPPILENTMIEEPELSPILENTMIEEPELSPILENTMTEEPELSPILENTMTEEPELSPILENTMIKEPELQSISDTTSILEEPELHPFSESKLPPISGNSSESNLDRLLQQMRVPEMKRAIEEPELNSLTEELPLSDILPQTDSLEPELGPITDDSIQSAEDGAELQPVTDEAVELPVSAEPEFATISEESDLRSVSDEPDRMPITEETQVLPQTDAMSQADLLESEQQAMILDADLQALIGEEEPQATSLMQEESVTKEDIRKNEAVNEKTIKEDLSSGQEITPDRLAAMVANLGNDMDFDSLTPDEEKSSFMAETLDPVIQNSAQTTDSKSEDDELEKIMKDMNIDNLPDDSLEDLDIDKILEIPLDHEKTGTTASNQVMSSEEIAALIANTELLSEPEPVKNDNLMDLSDPGHVMSSDEIAALIANM